MMPPEAALSWLAPNGARLDGLPPSGNAPALTAQDVAAAVGLVPNRAGQLLVMERYGGGCGELSLLRVLLLNEVVARAAARERWQDDPAHRKGLIGDLIAVELMLGQSPDLLRQVRADDAQVAGMVGLSLGDWRRSWRARFRVIGQVIGEVEQEALAVVFRQLGEG